jgi:uncharacterized membrane protein
MKTIGAAIYSTSLLALLAGCSDTTAVSPASGIAPPPGLAVSNSVQAVGISAPIGSSAAGGIAYISASPGTLPDALSGTLSNPADQRTRISIRIVDGGFDPVAIHAETGDELKLVLTSISGASLAPVAIKVPPRRPPKVVRTSPSKGRIDVALSIHVEVVFSEPLNRSTVTSASLSLSHAGVIVPATIDLSANGLSASVVPDEPLQPGQDYALVADGVQDLDGDILDDSLVTSFVTAFMPTSPAQVGSFRNLPMTAMAINEDGVVVGQTNDGETLLWKASVITRISRNRSFNGAALNDALVVVGAGPAQETFNGQGIISGHAVKWKDGTFTDLGTLPGHNYSQAGYINDAGDIVGLSGISNGDAADCCDDQHAVLWRNGQIAALPFPWAYGINDRGEILGGLLVNGVWKVLIWRDGVSTFPTGGCFDSTVPSGLSTIAMNNLGQITATCGNKPFFWENGEITMLPMPPGCIEGISEDIDDAARIVGYVYCQEAPTTRAVVWMNGSVFQLPASGQSVARKINNRGEIIGLVNHVEPVLWVLTPAQ